jgi:hypothetical protein
MAKRNSRQRIDPQLEDVPELRARVAPARSRDSGNEQHLSPACKSCASSFGQQYRIAFTFNIARISIHLIHKQGNNWIGYVIHMAPGPMMAVSPTVEMAKRNSRQRIDPQLEDVPELRARVAPARSRDSGNTVLSKEFPGGVLVMTGANSAVGLRSMPALDKAFVEYASGLVQQPIWRIAHETDQPIQTPITWDLVLSLHSRLFRALLPRRRIQYHRSSSSLTPRY